MYLMIYYLLYILASFQPAPTFGKIEGRVEFVDENVDRQGVVVLLYVGDSSVNKTYVNDSGYFQFESVPHGVYSLSVTQIGYRIVSVHDIHVKDGSPVRVSVQFPYPSPCPYHYTADFKPECARGHTDNVIPIVYGLPGKRMMKKAKRGKVHLSGCNVTACDPKFYCVTHQLEF